MTRHGGSGRILDALNLSYSGNRLAAVSHSGGTWSYGHDGSGRMTSDGRLGGIAVQYDSFLGRWTTVDPLAEKYPGFSPYSYCAGNPINFVDPDGKFPGFLWDIANVVMDVKSLVSNIKDHNTGAAIADGVGLVVDAVAAAIPILPAGAGTALKAARSGEKVAETIKVTEKIEGSVSKTKGSVKGIIVAQENKIDRTLLNPPHRQAMLLLLSLTGQKLKFIMWGRMQKVLL